MSSLGRVRSLDRVIHSETGPRRLPGKILRCGVSKSPGYQTVVLSAQARGTKSFRIHVMVAEAFLGDPPPDTQVNHKNGQKLDNRVENLEYVSRSQNIRHGLSLGLRKRSVSGRAHLTREDVIAIRFFFRPRGPQPSVNRILSRVFMVSESCISSIGRRKTHKFW